MALSDDYQRGLIQKSTYIRLAIASPRHEQGDSYEVALPLAGVTLAEVFSEASLLVRDELLEIVIAPFTVTWAQPELLPSFSPTAVQSMQVGGKGYLYFALGADNQAKTKTQACDPTRLYSLYSMSRSSFLAELGRLLETKTATVDIQSLSVRWLNKSAPAAREFGSIADVVVQLRKEINDAIARIPTSAPGVSRQDFDTAFNLLAEEINDRQLKGDYASLNHEQSMASIVGLQDAIAQIIQAIALKAPSAHTHQDLLDRLLSIETRAGTFSLSIDCGKNGGNPTLDSAGYYWIADCYFSGGHYGDNAVSNTTNTDVPALYQTERYGGCTYTIPVPEGRYTVKLYFAENYYTAAGQRVFDVDIQTRVLTSFDIFKEVGVQRKALIKSFPGIASSNKQIIVRISSAGTIMGLQLLREA